MRAFGSDRSGVGCCGSFLLGLNVLNSSNTPFWEPRLSVGTVATVLQEQARDLLARRRRCGFALVRNWSIVPKGALF